MKAYSHLLYTKWGGGKLFPFTLCFLSKSLGLDLFQEHFNINDIFFAVDPSKLIKVIPK